MPTTPESVAYLCTCGETACESELCDCDTVACPVDHAAEWAALPATYHAGGELCD